MRRREPILRAAARSGTATSMVRRKRWCMAQSDGEGKPAIRSPHLYPAYTIEDPALTVTLPVKHTVFTSVDALCHAVEAATAVTASPYCISLAKEAVRLTSIWLPTAIAQPGNLAARYWLMDVIFRSHIDRVNFLEKSYIDELNELVPTRRK